MQREGGKSEDKPESVKSAESKSQKMTVSVKGCK